ITRQESDRGAFKTPTLRNVALTAPYMHDGSIPTLERVVKFYAEGGNPNPHLDEEIRPLTLNADEERFLVAFLHALTGELPQPD
ncbi:MAG: cytochrome-c peroxidase, partial [Gemmatimonadetes bacterium]|nr:cytochrome-c peroxidase [Gemmatimonadota bacterium]